MFIQNEVDSSLITVVCDHCHEIIAIVDRTDAAFLMAALSEGEGMRKLSYDFSVPNHVLRPIVIYEGHTYHDDCAEEIGLHACYDCGCIVNTARDNYGAYADDVYCATCYDDSFTTCHHCGDVIYRNDSVSVISRGDGDTEEWCDACANNHAYTCDCCGARISRDVFNDVTTIIENDYGYVCPDCMDSGRFMQCSHCGNYFHTDSMHTFEDQPVCGNCLDELDIDEEEEASAGMYPFCCDDEMDAEEIIQGYHDYCNRWGSPVWVKRGISSPLASKKKLLIGVELEIDQGGENHAKAVKITSALGYPANESNEFKCTHDGSLDNGFEIISMPATYHWHITNYNWEAGMEKARELGYYSHNGGTCGLHFHVNRDYFEEAFENPHKSLVILLANNRNWLEKFSRRRDFKYCQFKDGGCKFQPEFFKSGWEVAENTERILDRILGDCGHYSALNIGGNATIEFRFIRGTLKYKTFKAAMQLIVMLCYAAKHFRKEQICSIDLKWFKRFAQHRNFSDFLEYLEDREITA